MILKGARSEVYIWPWGIVKKKGEKGIHTRAFLLRVYAVEGVK